VTQYRNGAFIVAVEGFHFVLYVNFFIMEEREFKMVSTSWMMPGVTCWVLSAVDEVGGKENAYIRGIIISLTPNRSHARMTYPEDRGSDEVPVGSIYEANQDYENYKNGSAIFNKFRVGRHGFYECP
jgi:hypothetical protein